MTEQKQSSRSFAGIAGIIAAATFLSKIFGLVRQVAITAAFGLGPVADAFQYAYTIPGFLLILLGGVNGPFYSAIVSVLAKRKKEEAAPLVETVTTLVGGALLIVSIGIWFSAPFLIDVFSPGLREVGKELTRASAIEQLQIMAPMAVLAGLIGIGFGVLNAANQFWLPAISPLLSSITVILGIGILYLRVGNKIGTPEYAAWGGVALAGGTLVGAIFQWLMQVTAQAKSGMGKFRLRFDLNEPGVWEILKIMLPATFASGMLYINLQTDLFFASLLDTKGVGAALGNAGLLVQTPLGIISNVILIPLLPMFARLASPENWPDLKLRIRQALILCAFTMLPLGALMVTLAEPIVRIVYQRGAFNAENARLVASLLIVNGIGMFAYLSRDVMVRVFYALGDAQTPFRISIFNIFLNATFDWLFTQVLGMGAPGLTLSTVTVNTNSLIMLTFFLSGKLNGLPMGQWSLPLLGMGAGSLISGACSFAVLKFTEGIIGSGSQLQVLIQLAISSVVGLAVFGVIVSRMKLPEVETFVSRFSQRFLKKK